MYLEHMIRQKLFHGISKAGERLGPLRRIQDRVLVERQGQVEAEERPIIEGKSEVERDESEEERKGIERNEQPVQTSTAKVGNGVAGRGKAVAMSAHNL